jgi:hypothetical protein
MGWSVEGVLGGYLCTTSLDVFGPLWRGELVLLLGCMGFGGSLVRNRFWEGKGLRATCFAILSATLLP